MTHRRNLQSGLVHIIITDSRRGDVIQHHRRLQHHHRAGLGHRIGTRHIVGVHHGGDRYLIYVCARFRQIVGVVTLVVADEATIRIFPAVAELSHRVGGLSREGRAVASADGRRRDILHRHLRVVHRHCDALSVRLGTFKTVLIDRRGRHHGVGGGGRRGDIHRIRSTVSTCGTVANRVGAIRPHVADRTVMVGVRHRQRGGICRATYSSGIGIIYIYIIENDPRVVDVQDHLRIRRTTVGVRGRHMVGRGGRGGGRHLRQLGDVQGVGIVPLVAYRTRVARRRGLKRGRGTGTDNRRSCGGRHRHLCRDGHRHRGRVRVTAGVLHHDIDIHCLRIITLGVVGIAVCSHCRSLALNSKRFICTVAMNMLQHVRGKIRDHVRTCMIRCIVRRRCILREIRIKGRAVVVLGPGIGDFHRVCHVGRIAVIAGRSCPNSRLHAPSSGNLGSIHGSRQIRGAVVAHGEISRCGHSHIIRSGGIREVRVATQVMAHQLGADDRLLIVGEDNLRRGSCRVSALIRGCKGHGHLAATLRGQRLLGIVVRNRHRAAVVGGRHAVQPVVDQRLAALGAARDRQIVDGGEHRRLVVRQLDVALDGLRVAAAVGGREGYLHRAAAARRQRQGAVVVGHRGRAAVVGSRHAVQPAVDLFGAVRGAAGNS